MKIPVPKLALIDSIAAALKKAKDGPVEVIGPWGSAKSLIAAQTSEAINTPVLCIAQGRIEAESIHDDLATFLGEDRALLLPAWETLPSDVMDPADDIIAERLDTLERLAKAIEAKQPICAVVPVRSLLQLVVPRKQLQDRTLTLKVGEEYQLDELLARLIKMGYERDVMVEGRGQMSVRGGIFDLFPISSELPCRIEFFGDEIESIRRFEPETQRSVDYIEDIRILPRSEKALLQEESKGRGLMPVTDYFPKDTLIVIDEPLAVREEAKKIAAQFHESPFFMSLDTIEQRLEKHPHLTLAQVPHDKAPGATRITATTQAVSSFVGKLDGFWDQLKEWDADEFTVVLLCINSGERRRLHELLEERGYDIGKDRFDLRIDIGRLRAGFISPLDKLAVLSEKEMLGRHYIRRKRRRFEAGSAIVQFGDLKVGDYIVHEHHGIGRYHGLRRFEGKPGDFMQVSYTGGDTLYVPVSHIDQIQKYVGGDGATPKMDRIGGASWSRTKAKVKKAVRDMTEELVKLYAARETGNGHAFMADTPWQQEFEDAFPYDETPDQLRAIQEVKADMQRAQPMDRLLCGDVGYGKTEVALRAAFKAVQDGKQVAILAPTTVLVQQHYNTFRERLADYPIRVVSLSRFHTAKENRLAIQQLNSGAADIVIGTHRLLSKDVKFRDLGLLVVDEEQRFGVAHKERIKQLRVHVDVLTMSATPIPRTLNFSLIGIRDMSLINTAPNDRLPIHTAIEAWDENVIKEAIERELSRQGQVFFLHNRVQTIDQVSMMVRRLVPQARLAIGHGQMERHQLEDVMTAFVNREVDVLICTTIIATGIDIPNANTIIVDRADMFGLAELYQIRGRVGRYKHRAFAYLLIPGDRALSEEAQQRLQALQEFSHLGSGFRIAMRDLEIRGAGNILGAEQSGSIQQVGYETYKDLIQEAVAEVRGEPLRRRNLPPFELNVDAFIPEEYVPATPQKITLYRRISGVQTVEEVDELYAELKDRFGAPPGPVKRLLEVMRARALAAPLGITRMAGTQKAVALDFESSRYLSRNTQSALTQIFGKHVSFAWKDTPSITYTFEEKADPVKETIQLLKALGDV